MIEVAFRPDRLFRAGTPFVTGDPRKDPNWMQVAVRCGLRIHLTAPAGCAFPPWPEVNLTVGS